MAVTACRVIKTCCVKVVGTHWDAGGARCAGSLTLGLHCTMCGSTVVYQDSHWRVNLARPRGSAERRRRVSASRGLVGRLAGARPAAAARPAPYHTNKIYLMDNRPTMGYPLKFSRFTTRLLMT